MRQRNYRFDTAKFVLIWMVIIVHAFWSYWNFPANSSFAWFRTLLLAYAMPVFSFISGYFIPTDKIKWERVVELFFVCVAFNIVGVAWGQRIGVIGTFWSVAPVMWYLWVYCACLISVPLFMKRNKEGGLFCAFLLSWVVCLFSSTSVEWKFMGRFCGFFPFFALGAYIGSSSKAILIREALKGDNTAYLPFIIGGGYVCALIFSLCWPHIATLGVGHYWLGGGVKMLVVRLFFQALAIVMGFCFLMLIPNRKSIFACLGGRTLAPYLLHWYIVFSFARLVSKFTFLQSFPIHVAVMGLAAVSCTIFFHPFFSASLSRAMTIVSSTIQRVVKPFHR